MLDDEFVIDESDRSFASRAWITIPRKAVPGKQHTVLPTESTTLLQSKKSREKHHNVSPMNLTSEKYSGKTHQVEKSQLSGQKKLGRNCALTDEMDNNCRSTKYEMYSENAEKSSRNKRTIKQKQKRKLKTNVVEKQVDTHKNINTSHIAKDKSQRNLEGNMEECKEKRNVRVSKKRKPPGGKCLY